MKKRMLCLLLALVMTLSLCVPALAADEFAAEAVTEVEEQAPVAPVEPEAPEAEEPAEEPVADEPDAEEPVEAADVPEVASVIPEEMADEPMLVALGIVSKEAHWKLYKAVQAAEELLPKVKAGELYATGFSFTFPADIAEYADDPVAKDPFKDADQDFAKELEVAKAYLDGIDGVEVEYDVTTSTVNAEAEKLNAYIPDVDPADSDLTDDISSMDLDTVKTTFESDAVASADSKVELSIAADTDVTKDATWKKVYHSDYLTALQAAIDAVNDYPTSPKYADFTAVIKLMLDALVLEKASANPAASDMTALDAAITKATNANKNYDPDDYVLGTDDNDLEELIAKANSYKGDTTGMNGFADDVSYFMVNEVIEQIDNALVKKANTIQYESHKWDDSDKKTVDVTASVTQVTGSEATGGDGKNYAYAWQVDGLWYAGDTTEGTKTLDKKNGIKTITNGTAWKADEDYEGKYITNDDVIQVTNLYDGSGQPDFTGSEKITIHFYEVRTSGSLTDYVEITGKAKTFTVSEGYDGPVLKKAEVTDYNESATITDIGTTDLVSGSYDYDWNGGSGETSPLDIKATLSKEMGSITNYKLSVDVGKKNVAEMTTGISDDEPTIAADDVNDEVYLVAGDTVTVTLKVAAEVSGSPTDDDYITHGSVSLKVDPLSKWGQIPAIKKVLEAAGKLVSSDYKLGSARYDVHSVAEAFTIINRDISKINSNITSTTLANTAYNRNATAQILKELVTVCGYLEPNKADLTELNSLLVEAGEKLADDAAGKTDYSFDTIGALKDLYDYYTGSDALDEDDLQSVVDAAAAKVEAAIKALAGEAAPDKSALNAAIAKADALKEADYTPESWAAAKPAIDTALEAAKAVAANDKATQAQITAALNALNGAMESLVAVTPVEPEGPKAPTTNNGTGWNYYEGEWYFFKNSKLVSNYWVGKIDGASQWDNNWYYVGADGKMLTGMQYLDDLHGGMGWYFLQPTNTKGEIGKMLTGWQYVDAQYGSCWFSTKSGESGKCTYSSVLGDWNGTSWEK